jgi:hypothetical protein
VVIVDVPHHVRQQADNVNMGREKLEAAYWQTVEDCLVEFHQIAPDAAVEQVRSLRQRLAKTDAREPKRKPTPPMIYHLEPWYVACNLADEQLVISGHKRAYDAILRRNGLKPRPASRAKGVLRVSQREATVVT